MIKDTKLPGLSVISLGKTLRFVALGALLAAASAVRGSTIQKANNSDDLDLTTSWVGGVVPTNSDVATWDSTVSAANTTLLATDASWAGLKILNPGGLVTINSTSTNAIAGATLTLGASGLDMSAASQDLTLGGPLALLGDTTQNWILGAGHTLTLNGGLVRNAAAMLSIDNTSGGIMVDPIGTALAGFPYITLNGTDFGALDSSLTLVPATSAIAFTPNPSTSTANGASLSGTQQWIDIVSSNPLNGPSAFRLSSTLTTSGGVRFNMPNSLGVDWVMDANSRNFNLNHACILITSNVGPQNVVFRDSATGMRISAGGEVMFSQRNPFGDFIITGHISQPSGSGANVMKNGVGRVIYAPSSGISYGGLTDIEEGTLLVDSSISSSQVNVNGGATLGGIGRVNAVTVAAAGVIAPGDTNGVGSLTIGGNLILNAGSALNFYAPTVPTTNTVALLNLTNSLTVNGTVNVSILSGSAVAGQYPLVKWTNAIDGATFAQFKLAFLPPHSGGYLSNNVDNSSIDLVITNVNEPITWATGNGVWDINTSVNWRDAGGNPSVFQQNGSLADSVVFEDTLSGTSPITVTLNANVAPPTTLVNASKNYTISGTGGIGGVGSLTKAGSGTLTLATANTFSGGINLNGGTTVFSSLANLGNGDINFGGGALQYASGNVEDLSTRTVTFGAGGGTINDGGNTLFFVNPIGNGGIGGFTKSGSGNLTLNGTNGYSGNTIISQGTLTLAFSSYISNSTAIIIDSGATLDDSQNAGLVLGTTVGQTVFGAGTVSGGLMIPAGTTISPATNGVIGALNEANGDVTFTGGTYVCDMGSVAHDKIEINGNLTLTSGKLQLNELATLPNGSYTLIHYTGALLSGTGSSANLTVTGFSEAGKSATLSDDVPGQINLIISDTANDALTWSGSAGSTWDLTSSLNWLNGANPWSFTNGDAVTFDDSSANNFVSLQTAVKPGSVTVNNTTTTYTLADGTGTGAGKISGPATLTKNGSGTLVLDVLNDNTGGVTINNGTVQVGDLSSSGNIGSGNVTDNASLVFMQPDNRSVNGAISGSGTLTQQGNGTLTLAQNNTYAGATTIASGTLQVGTGTGVGTLGPAAVTNNGTLVFDRSGSFAVNNGITGSGNLTFNGTATVTLGGANSYTGATTVGAGTTVKLAAAGVIPDTGAGNNNVSVSGKLDLNGFDLAVSRLNGGSGEIVNDAGTGTNNLIIDYDGTGSADTSVIMADNDGTGGKLAVVKTGAGSQIVRGASTYTGGTIISNGTLNVRGSSALSTGPVIFRGGNLSLAAVTLANPIIAETNATFDSPGSENLTITGDLTTSSNLTVVIDNNETWSWGSATQLYGDTGTIFISTGPGFFRFAGSQGSPNTTFDMTGSGATITSKSAGTFELGALVGDFSPFIGASGGSTFVIGGKNLSTEFDGTFNSTSNNLTKVGTGTFTIGGSMGFTGDTTVSNGVLALTNSATLDSNFQIAIRNGSKLDMSGIGGTLNLGAIGQQTLTGAGTILGSVTAIGGGEADINPGDGIGALNITNALTLAANSVVTMELNRTNAGATNDMIVAGSIVPNGATLNVTNLGSDLIDNDTFKLFNQPVSGFATIVLPSTDSTGASTYVWKTNLDVDGSITLVSGGASPVNTTPANLAFQVSGGQITLSWPADHTGWRLQAQTNAPGVGLNSTNWYDVVGASSTDTVTIPINPTNGPVFYRMIYP